MGIYKVIQLVHLLVSRRFFREVYLVSSVFFSMKTDEYSTEVNGLRVAFYHNQSNHKMEIIIDYDIQNPYVVTLAKGQAIIEFLRLFPKL